MILIADSGSTKTVWSLVQNGIITDSWKTSGINPFLMDKQEVFCVLCNELTLPKGDIENIYFYGAGCIPSKVEVVDWALKTYFNTESIEIHTDLLGAARALCQKQPGIACILGTGSNSCYFDGMDVVENVSPLGFILGDEGSGAYLGKRLSADILKNQAPAVIREAFFATYSVTREEIMENVYHQPFPNRYLAEYAKFIYDHRKDEFISHLVEDGFREFICRNLLQYNTIRELVVHFTGSIAFYFKENLIKVMNEQNLKTGIITQSPMGGLVEFHSLYK